MIFLLDGCVKGIHVDMKYLSHGQGRPGLSHFRGKVGAGHGFEEKDPFDTRSTGAGCVESW
jgi:hypothetical protein